MRVLLSIKPKYANRIFSGEKRYEFRRAIWKNSEVFRAVLYASTPISKVVGEFEIGDVYDAPPNNLWDWCKNGAGISKERFFKYFSGKDIGHAISIRTIWQFENPVPLRDYGIERPPQNFMYLDD